LCYRAWAEQEAQAWAAAAEGRQPGSSLTGSWITIVIFIHDLDLDNDNNNNLGTSFGAGAYSVNPSVIPIFSVSAVACTHGLSIAYVANCT